MYTLKIRWTRQERSDDGIVGVVDESTLFLPARTITVHAFIAVGERESVMKAWEDSSDSYFDYLNRVDLGDSGYQDAGRLIHLVTPEGQDEWYLATQAWLLGPNGDTIERIAP